MNWHNSDQSDYASHEPATYVDSNHTQGRSSHIQPRFKFPSVSTDNLEDVSLNVSMRSNVRRGTSTAPDKDDEMNDDNFSVIRERDHRGPEKLYPG